MCDTESRPDSSSMVACADVDRASVVIRSASSSRQSVTYVAALAIKIISCDTERVGSAVSAYTDIGLTV
jgi:hypothetical protein